MVAMVWRIWTCLASLFLLLCYGVIVGLCGGADLLCIRVWAAWIPGMGVDLGVD